MNFPLLSIIFTIAFTVTIGILIIAAVVTGFDKGTYIIGAIVVGGLISLPVSVVLTKKIGALTSKGN